MRDLGRACTAASPPLYGSTRPLHHPKTAISTLNSPPDRAPPLATRASVLALPLAPRAIRRTPASPSRPQHSLIRQVIPAPAGPTFWSEGSQPCSCRHGHPIDGAGLAISLGVTAAHGWAKAPPMAPTSPSRSGGTNVTDVTFAAMAGGARTLILALTG